jgi:predicted alpha/beta hydrolase family esterase
MTPAAIAANDPGGPVDVLFIQGAGEHAHDADRALADALARHLGTAWRIRFPLLPDEADPDHDRWRIAIAAEARRSTSPVLVAHSAGAAIAADLLAQGLYGSLLPRLRGLFLLAPPFVGPGGWSFDGFHFDGVVGRDTLDGLPIRFYFGLADAVVPPAHATLYEEVFPEADFYRLAQCDHQFEGHLAQVADDIRLLVPRDDCGAAGTPLLGRREG